jgi:hypothetical protein
MIQELASFRDAAGHVKAAGGMLSLHPSVGKQRIPCVLRKHAAAGKHAPHLRVVRLGSLISAAHLPQGLCLTPL